MSNPRRGILIGHSGLVSAVAFSPDGHTLASAASDKTVKLWEVVTRDDDDLVKEVCAIPGRSLTRAEWEQYIPELDFQQICG